ncbi:MAG: hypothetical protein IJY28_00015 [Clostridia bacterium]|nr:hypothetical protein [Clostridia bacterium]
MKTMKLCKRMMALVLIFVLMVSLSGCIIIPLTKYYDIPAEEVASVQFYDLSGEEIPNESGFDEVCEPVWTVPETDHEALLDDFSKLKFSDAIVIVLAAYDPSFSYGDWVVRINFTNGQYTFYSCGGYSETFDANGKWSSATHFSCDREELEQLIGKYYEAGAEILAVQ